VKTAPARKKSTGYAGVMVLAVLLTAGNSRRQQAVTTQATAQAPAGNVSLALDPQQSSLHWTLDTTLHTVHGTFLLKRGVVEFDPASGKASGEIVVAAASGESGDNSRDKKMHREVLESAKYPEIVFRPDRIDRKIPGSGSWSAGIHGVFVLHGAEHELTVPVQGEFTGEHWKGTAKFSVPYIQWGLKNPSNFLLKADTNVEIELAMSGGMQSGSAK
jgi:polyisoprenoid-binding protein YceI